MLTAVVIITALGFFLQQPGAALGAGHAGVLGDGLGVFTLRIARAGQEFAEAAVFDDHSTAAELADLIGFLIGDLDALFVQIDLRLLQLRGKVRIKLPQDLPVIHLAGFHLVQLGLHGGGELDIHDILKFVDHQIGDGFAQIGGPQGPALLGHIFPVQNDGNGGRIGGGASHALFLHGLDQGSLGVAGGGLGKMLLRIYRAVFRRVAGLQAGQRRSVALLLLVGALLIQGQKAREGHALAGGPEQIAAAADVCRDGIQNGVAHLAGDKALPDQLIQAVLIRRQAPADALRLQAGIGGTDGLMGVLRRFFLGEDPGLGGLIFRAVAAGDIGPRRGGSLCGDAQRVGTHIGDETGVALALQLHALIKLLCHRHGALGRHAQLAGGLLLKGGGGEGRRGLALFPGVFHGLHLIGLAVDGGKHRLNALLVGQLQLARLRAEEMGGEIPGVLPEHHIDAPVFHRLEGADLPLPVHHHAGDHALDAAGGKACADLAPQEGRELIAHDAVQNPPGLLGVHQIHVDAAGVLDGVGNGGAGDLVEGDPLALFRRQLQKLLQMPGDGFTLPVRVGGEIDEIRLLRRGLQLADDLVLALDGDIGGLEIMVHIHAQFLFGQIAKVSHGRLDLKAAAQVAGDGLGLGGGFHNEKLCHVFPPFHRNGRFQIFS